MAGHVAGTPVTEPASFDGGRHGGGVLVGLDGAHAHGALSTSSLNAQIGLFSHVRVYYGAGFNRRMDGHGARRPS